MARRVEHLSQPDKPPLHQSLEALIGKGVEMHTPRVGITDKAGLLAGLGNRRVTDYARKLVNMPEVKISTEPRDATVVIVTGSILVPDSKGYITTEQARQAAENLGLSPIQVDEFLATLPSVDQPRGDWVVGMHEPIMGSVDDPEQLIAERSGGGLWLWGYLGRPGSEWLSDYRFAFSLRK